MRTFNTLQAAREAAGLSLQGLSDAADVSRQYLIVLEAGKSAPSLGVARRIASALSTSVDAIWPAEERT
jgi:DNA-binding XRE family transcriptional regulator